MCLGCAYDTRLDFGQAVSPSKHWSGREDSVQRRRESPPTGKPRRDRAKDEVLSDGGARGFEPPPPFAQVIWLRISSGLSGDWPEDLVGLDFREALGRSDLPPNQEPAARVPKVMKARTVQTRHRHPGIAGDTHSRLRRPGRALFGIPFSADR